MNGFLRAVSLFLLPPALLCAQADSARTASDAAAGAQPRTKGTIFKSEVDRLVEALHEGAIAGKSTLGGDSALATAKILCAMGHCHRHYSIQDSPQVRNSLRQLFEQRGRDGSFGQVDAQRATLTGWVTDALAIIDPAGSRAEREAAIAWLDRQHAERSPWQQQVSQVLAQVRGDRFPQDIGKPAADQVVQLLAERPQHLQTAPAADLLVGLVACQAANRLLDGQKGEPAAAFSPAQQKGFDWLMQQQQDGVFLAPTPDGKKFPDEGFTGFGLQGLQSKPKQLRSAKEQAVIEQGLQWLLSKQNDDGSWGTQTINYYTSVVVGALARWDAPEAKPALQKAQKFLLEHQNIEQRGYGKSDRDYGSMGYGGGASRGDLSNLHFALQALRSTGLPADDEAFAKAVVFLQRTQNLRSVNDFTSKSEGEDGKLTEIVPADDGGGIYYPGNSEFGFVELPDGRKMPRSYGSMTYALLKAYSLCGIGKDDPRLQAAAKWVQEHWTVTFNPGFDPQAAANARYAGLYYYYMVLAQALDAAGIDQLQVTGDDGKPKTVDWRQALRQQLEKVQRQDGSWVNGDNGRWFESMPMICTSYAMLALELCR